MTILLRPLRAVAFLLVFASLSAALAEEVFAQIYLNEVTIQGVERVELYNRGISTVPIGGWRIEGASGVFIIPGGTQIGGNSYYETIIPGDIFDNIGGETVLIDLLNFTRDRVTYGQLGSAPLPPPYDLLLASTGASLARAPDASLAPPPADNPATDGIYWTLDLTPTFAFINDAPIPTMGATVALNELSPSPINVGDPIELFNPTFVPASVNNWFISTGDVIFMINGVIPPLGFLVLNTPVGVELEHTGLCYLFMNDGTRVDQLGFWDQVVPANRCLARCPDGEGPYLGYSFFTSGGGLSFFLTACTLNLTNTTAPGCVPVAVEEASTSAESALEVWPSVLRGGICHIALTAPIKPASMNVSIVDLAGRIVQTVPLRHDGSGRLVGTWDGRDASGLQAPIGNYWVRAIGAEQAARVLLLH